MEQSILKSTKKILNIGEDDTSFDLDVMTHINTAFSHLQQLGIGPDAGFQIEDATTEWAELLGEASTLPVINSVKAYIHLKVRLVFDPPTLPHVLNALKEALTEAEWRLNVMREESDWVDPDPADLLVVDGGDPSD